MLNIFKYIIEHPKLVLIALLAMALVCIFFMYKENRALHSDNDRLSNNQTALMTDIEKYKTESGKNAAKARTLELTADEFKQTCKEQESIIKELGIKVKRLESISSTGTKTNVNAKTKLRDTVFITRLDTLYIKEKGKYFKWSDPWNSIEGNIKGDEVECNYHGEDTIHVVINRVPKKFLFFRFGTKYVEVNMVNSNPSSIITYNKTIRVQK